MRKCPPLPPSSQPVFIIHKSLHLLCDVTEISIHRVATASGWTTPDLKIDARWRFFFHNLNIPKKWQNGMIKPNVTRSILQAVCSTAKLAQQLHSSAERRCHQTSRRSLTYRRRNWLEPGNMYRHHKQITLHATWIMTLKLTTYKCKGTETGWEYAGQIRIAVEHYWRNSLRLVWWAIVDWTQNYPQLLKPVLFRGGFGRSTVQFTGASWGQFSQEFNESRDWERSHDKL